jgi:hypothetical protein
LLRDSKESWSCIAWLGLRGHSADLDVAKSQSMQLTHQLGILVEACSHADAIWKADACHNNLLAA